VNLLLWITLFGGVSGDTPVPIPGVFTGDIAGSSVYQGELVGGSVYNGELTGGSLLTGKITGGTIE
jgi:hypothetical protein